MINFKELRALAYLDAVVRFIKRGHGFCSKEQVEKRLNICLPCEHFTGSHCDLCDCCANDKRSLFNKLAFPTERCPDHPPRWIEE